MPQVFDPQTGKPVDASPEDATAGLVSGKYGLDSGAGPVFVKGQDGTVYQAPPEKVGDLLAKGTYSLLSPAEELTHKVRAQEAAKGVTGDLASAAESFTDQALLGVPGAVQDETDTPEQAAERKAREDYHAVGRTLAGIAGGAASLMYGGEGFKAAEALGDTAAHFVAPASRLADAGLATQLAAKSVSYATQGAALAAPAAIVHAAFGDPQEAAETLLWGVGAGAVLGAGSELFTQGTSKAAEGIQGLIGDLAGSERGGQFATDTTLQTLGAQKTQTSKWSPERRTELADFAHDEGIITPEMSRSELADRVETTRKKYGGAIEDAIKGLDGALDKDPTLAEHAITPYQFTSALTQGLESPSLRMPMNADVAAAVDKIVESAKMVPTTDINGQQVIKFGDAQDFVSELRSKYGKAIKNAQNDGGAKGLETVSAADQVRANAYQLASNMLNARANAFALATDQPELVGALTKAKIGYSKVKDIEKAVANLQAQAAGNKMISLTDEIRGISGPVSKVAAGAGGAIGGMIGGFPGAYVGSKIGAAVGVPLDVMAKKWGEDRGMVILSSLAKRAARDGPEVFSAVLASEGAKRVAATMEGVQDTIRRMAMNGIAATKGKNLEHMGHLLGDTSGLSHDQQWDKLGDRLNELSSNPAALAQVTGTLSSAFGSTDPRVAQAYQQQMSSAVAYLNNAFPRPPTAPLPFAPSNWSPTPNQKLAFHDRASIVANPMKAMEHVARGTLSDAHLDAIHTVYPKLHGKMVQAINDFHADNPDVLLPLQERTSVARFIGQALDPTALPQNLLALQKSYEQTGPGGNPNGPPPGEKMPKGKIKNRQSAASSFQSTMGPSEAA